MTNVKMIVLGFISVAAIAGCSSTDKRDEPVTTVSTYPSDTYIAPPDEVTTTYSSADLGSSSSGMGR